MKSFAALLLLATAATAIQVNRDHNSKLYQLSKSLSRAQQTNNGQKCDAAIQRMKKPTIDYKSKMGTGVAFTDTDFKLDIDGLWWPQYSTAGDEWTGIYDIFRARDKLPQGTLWGTVGAAGPSDLDQGWLGDCYFLSACSAVAEWSDRAKKLFVTQDYNKEGIIVVKGLILGNQKEIVIDDFLPFWKGTNSLIFDQISDTQGLWGPFIEKAWAKVNGYYDRTNGGWASEVFQFMFGLPTTKHSNGKGKWITSTDIWNIINNSDKSQYIIWAATPGSGNDQLTQKYGLAQSHAYTVISTHIVNFANGTEAAKLLRIRNPWGIDADYNGTWCDSSAKWTDTVNKFSTQVPFKKDTQDGIYFVDLQTFQESFSDVQIAFYNDAYVSSTATIYTDVGLGSKFEFTLGSAVDGFFGIDFYNTRMYPVGCKTTFTQLYMQVYLDGKVFSTAWADETQNYGFIQGTWPAGKYMVLTSAHYWDNNDVRDFSFRTFLPVSVVITGTNFKTSDEKIAALASIDFASLKNQPWSSTDSINAFRWNFIGSANNIYTGFQGTSTTKKCTLKFKFSAIGADGTMISDQAASACTKGQATASGTTTTTFTCTCITTGTSQCNFLIAVKQYAGQGQSTSFGYNSRTCV
eukprot:403336970